MRQSDNNISVANIIRCLESEKPEFKNRIQRSTLQKHLQDEGMARRDLVTGAAQHGRKNLGRFQKNTGWIYVSVTSRSLRTMWY